MAICEGGDSLMTTAAVLGYGNESGTDKVERDREFGRILRASPGNDYGKIVF